MCPLDHRPHEKTINISQKQTKYKYKEVTCDEIGPLTLTRIKPSKLVAGAILLECV